MSEAKSYLLTYTPGPKPPVIVGKSGPLQYTERKDFDTKEEAISRADELWASGQGHNFVLYKDFRDGTSLAPLMGYSDFEGEFRLRNFRRCGQQADD